MPKKKPRRRSSSRLPKPSKSSKAELPIPAKLSKTEQDLLWHMAQGYQLETSSRWDNPILRRLKDNAELRAIANRSTIEALHDSGLIKVAKEGGVINPTVWRLAPKRLR